MKWSKYKGVKLGTLCKRKHAHKYGKSYRVPNGTCIECSTINLQARRKAKPQAYRDYAWAWRDKNKIAALVHNIRSMHKSHITVEDLKPFPAHCPLLGTKLEYSNRPKADCARPSIDRIIPAKGYVKGNVRILSFRANTIKNDASFEEFETMYFKWKALNETETDVKDARPCGNSQRAQGR